MHRLKLALVAAILCSVVYYFPAAADGIPLPGALVKKLPTIPMQRAVIAFRDGQEQLIIESSLEGEGDEFAWIIPVPATPTEFKEVSPGLIKTLSQRLQPEVVWKAAFWRWHGMALGATLFVLVWILVVLHYMPKSRFWPTLTLPLMVLPAMYEGAMSSPRGSEEPLVRVESAIQTETYDLAVLDADTPAALNAWLAQNGFIAVPEKGAPIVADYLKQGWRFVAAKIRKESLGVRRPQPLSMTFPADAPIYPMRLTALAGSKLYLEIITIADRAATCEPLTTEISDRYHFDSEAILVDKRTTNYPTKGEVSFASSAMMGDAYGLYIAHPSASALLWDGCTVTKLVGTLSPTQMVEDLRPHLGHAIPYRLRLYPDSAARGASIAFGLAIWVFAAPLVLLATYHRLGKGRWGRAKLLATLPPIIALAILGRIVVNGILPRAAEYETNYRLESPHSYALFDEGFNAAIASLSLLDSTTDAQIGQHILDYLAKSEPYSSYLQDQKLEYEDSPGNFTVRREDNAIVVIWYGIGGAPTEVRYSLESNPL